MYLAYLRLEHEYWLVSGLLHISVGQLNIHVPFFSAGLGRRLIFFPAPAPRFFPAAPALPFFQAGKAPHFFLPVAPAPRGQKKAAPALATAL